MKKIIQNIACQLVGLMFINAGLNKFLQYIPVPDDLPEQVAHMNAAIAEIGWLLPLVAIAEIIGGLLFIFPRFRALGAIILFPVIIGILMIHLTVAPSGLPLAMAIFLVLLWGMYDHRDKYLQLVNMSHQDSIAELAE
ncbi:DoxX family membrane protein [Rhodohalobacter sp. SW132]|uniref:DoxX family protein n=1 Tax=Rhodohalobacter sp. SW132 TaxID=2293433 RepID=UPI000E2844A5|nr:DoxX family protein [Rhodohalobacter sp. SW132]REL24021.1 DoxX family membrane protein [Rhodohalobacter sp. SW132]